MATVLRRRMLALATIALLAGPALAGQAPPPSPAPAQAPAGTPPAATRPAPTPEMQAYRDAMAVKDPAQKLEALRKLQADFPKSPQARSAESAIFTALVTHFKDREAEILASIEKQRAAIPPGSSPDLQLRAMQTIATGLVDNNVMLERAESLLRQALGQVDRAAYVADRRATAERARQYAEQRQKTQATPPPNAASLPVVPSDQELSQQFDRTAAGVYELLGRIALARGDSARAEQEFEKAFAANASLARAPLELARLASARGDDRKALDYYVTLAAAARLKRGDEDAFLALFRKIHGNGADVEAAIDAAYREHFPNPIASPASYAGPRTNRVALLEMFTGAACPPCVSADLALDAVIERYPADAIAVLAYHAHIPGPDPMVVPGSDVRRLMYAVRGVPTFNVDGALARLGGGSREMARGTFDTYVKAIDKALEAPADADVTVSAALEGTKVIVKASVANVRRQKTDLRLHLVLAEKHLTFSGENGIRFHPFVVRDVAGDKSGGFPIPDPAVTTAVEHVFDLSAIPDTVARSLADHIADRRKNLPADAAPREYRAEGRAMTKVDPSQLVVVAFVQDAVNSAPAPPKPATASPDATLPQVTGSSPQASPAFRVLQAAWTAIAPGTHRH